MKNIIEQRNVVLSIIEKLEQKKVRIEEMYANLNTDNEFVQDCKTQDNQLCDSALAFFRIEARQQQEGDLELAEKFVPENFSIAMGDNWFNLQAQNEEQFHQDFDLRQAVSKFCLARSRTESKETERL